MRMANEERRVLLVDDEEMLRTLWEIVLEDKGYTVRTAHNGKEALEVLAGGFAPGCIVSDVRMPVIDGSTDGLAFVEQVRALYPESTAVIYLASGTWTAGELEKARELGVRETIHKPVSNDTLIALVAKAYQPIEQNPASDQ